MPEHSNDRLESFFKKVSGRPDISFNEDDWKKLEAKLDAKEARSSVVRRNRNRIAGATAVTILLMSGLYWLSQSDTELTPVVTSENVNPAATSSIEQDVNATPSVPETDLAADKNKNNDKTTVVPANESSMARRSNNVKVKESSATLNSGLAMKFSLDEEESIEQSSVAEIPNRSNEATEINSEEWPVTAPADASVPFIIAAQADEPNDLNDTKNSPATADKTKQKANMADSVVREKDDVKVKDAYGSGLTEHPTSPRLSLLLSIAPDFSTVAFDYYTDPGRAIGLTLHYHIKRSLSFSTGGVLSHKKYIGDGEDYKPPSGYWKNNTNGIIPETIYGSCNILEIPLMVHYAIINKGKNRLLVGGGASSYIMLDESYKYNFEDPNPGAKQGWNSKKESTLFFNMINVTAGFERRISPGFMIGIEPYLKIPLQGIGWSNMKLYSAGASVTVRYILINQKNPAAF